MAASFWAAGSNGCVAMVPGQPCLTAWLAGCLLAAPACWLEAWPGLAWAHCRPAWPSHARGRWPPGSIHLAGDLPGLPAGGSSCRPKHACALRARPARVPAWLPVARPPARTSGPGRANPTRGRPPDAKRKRRPSTGAGASGVSTEERQRAFDEHPLRLGLVRSQRSSSSEPQP